MDLVAGAADSRCRPEGIGTFTAVESMVGLPVPKASCQSTFSLELH